MFHKVFCVRILLVLCFFNTVSRSSEHAISYQSSNRFETCEDVTLFLNKLHSLPLDEAFHTIITPLGCTGCPIETKFIHNKLTQLLQRGKLDVKSILTHLKHIGHLNRNDVLISTLMAITELPTIESSVKADISDTIFYLLKKRYSGTSRFGAARKEFCEYRSFSSGSGGGLSDESNVGHANRLLYSVLNSGTHGDSGDQFLYQMNTIGLLLKKVIASEVQRQLYLKQINNDNGQPHFRPRESNKATSGYHGGNHVCAVGKHPNHDFTKTDSGFPFGGTRRTGGGYSFGGTPRTDSGFSFGGTPSTDSGFSFGGTPRTDSGFPFEGTRRTESGFPFRGAGRTHSGFSVEETGRTDSGFPFRGAGRTHSGFSVEETARTDSGFPFVGTRRTDSGFPVGGNAITNRGGSKIIHAENLINLIPRPKSPKEQPMYDKLKDLLTSSQVQEIIKTINTNDNPTDQEILDRIIKTVLETTHTETIREVIEYYYHFKEPVGTRFNFALLIDALPQPENEKEKEFYHILKTFLMSENVYRIKLSNRFKEVVDLKEKLLILFEQLSHTSTLITSEVQQAVAYYLPILKGKILGIHFSNLITLIPAPKSVEEIAMYNLLKSSFSSNSLYVLLQHVDFRNLTPNQQLMVILRRLITQSQDIPLSHAAAYYRDLLITKTYGFSYIKLLQSLQTKDNVALIEILKNYFNSPEFEGILAHLQLAKMSDTEQISTIFETIETSTTVPPEVVQAVKKIRLSFQRNIFYDNINAVIKLIPLPKTEKEIKVYTTVKTFLLSDEAYEILKHTDFTIFQNDNLLLDYILKTVIESSVSSSIKNAFEYYIDLTESLESIEFVTRKEIKKNFKLTEIFTDTLNLKSLTLSQKYAFKKFFKYISQDKPDAMSKFDSWDQAKTRGEFVKLMFEYLLKMTSTPTEIKESIHILDSLVNMHGKGALPP